MMACSSTIGAVAGPCGQGRQRQHGQREHGHNDESSHQIPPNLRNGGFACGLICCGGRVRGPNLGAGTLEEGTGLPGGGDFPSTQVARNG
jgi:hypothetical protein